MMTSLLSPMDPDNLLHHLLTGLPQVLLVVRQFRSRAFTGVNFTVLHRGVKTRDKVPCSEIESIEFIQSPYPYQLQEATFTTVLPYLGCQ